MKQGYIIHSERGCVHTCSNCNERIELFYPDGTEVVTLPYCPYCGCSLGEKNEVNVSFMTSPIGDLPINSEGLRKAIDKIVELSANHSGKYNRALEKLSKEKRLNAELQKEIERLKTENCHDYHCMCLAQQEKAELQKQVDELTKHLHKAVALIKENSDLWFKYKFGAGVE